MSELAFNIKKRGAHFVAFDTVDKKRSYGKISIISGRFTGDTKCLIALKKYLADYNKPFENEKEVLVDKTIERIKQDIIEGDVTAIDELLRFVPIDNLKGYLAED